MGAAVMCEGRRFRFRSRARGLGPGWGWGPHGASRRWDCQGGQSVGQNKREVRAKENVEREVWGVLPLVDS